MRTPAQLEAFARYEFAIGQYMLTAPCQAVCGYDERLLGAEAVAELACLHPFAGPGATPFHLYPATPDGNEIHLSGELDAAVEEQFRRALRSAGPGAQGGPIVVHGDALRFVDHRSLRTLQQHAARLGTTAVVRTPHTSAGRLAGLMGLDRLRVEVMA